jgi:hypothetical protein
MHGATIKTDNRDLLAPKGMCRLKSSLNLLKKKEKSVWNAHWQAIKYRCTISPTHRNQECSWKEKETNTSIRKRIQKSNFAEKVLVSVFWDVEEVTYIKLLPSNKIQHTSTVLGSVQWTRSGYRPRGVNWQHDSGIVLKLLDHSYSC